MISKSEQIRALNDALRQNFHEGTANYDTRRRRPRRRSRRSHCQNDRLSMTISATPTTHTKNTTLDRLRSMARRYFSRSIISTRRLHLTRLTQLIRRSPSASLPSCWLRRLLALGL
jgi:hypothetical protein